METIQEQMAQLASLEKMCDQASASRVERHSNKSLCQRLGGMRKFWT